MRRVSSPARWERDVRLEALLLEGLCSRRIPLDVEFRKGLEAKVEQILDKYQAQP
jgi:hypothetical protein